MTTTTDVLVDLAPDGNCELRSYAERLLLYDEHVDVAFAVARGKYYTNDGDVVVAACTGVWKATGGYDPSQYTNVTFRTYAYHLADGEVKHLLRPRKSDAMSIGPISLDEDDTDCCSSNHPDYCAPRDPLPFDMFETAVPSQYHKGLYWLIENALHDMEHKDIAARECISWVTVRNSIKSARKYLRLSASVRDWAQSCQRCGSLVIYDDVPKPLRSNWSQFTATSIAAAKARRAEQARERYRNTHEKKRESYDSASRGKATHEQLLARRRERYRRTHEKKREDYNKRKSSA